eukprot:scaffold3081_cov114-Isochrysis_galbana.AAC.2
MASRSSRGDSAQANIAGRDGMGEHRPCVRGAREGERKAYMGVLWRVGSLFLSSETQERRGWRRRAAGRGARSPGICAPTGCKAEGGVGGEAWERRLMPQATRRCRCV